MSSSIPCTNVYSSDVLMDITPPFLLRRHAPPFLFPVSSPPQTLRTEDRPLSAIGITFLDYRACPLNTPVSSPKLTTSYDVLPHCCAPPMPPAPNSSSNTPLIVAPFRHLFSCMSVTRRCG
eukprot:1656095-Pleurochrysis_carterae.AAC.1